MKLYNERTIKDFLWIIVLYSCKVNGDHTLLIYPSHGQGAKSDADNAEAFAFYEINHPTRQYLALIFHVMHRRIIMNVWNHQHPRFILLFEN